MKLFIKLEDTVKKLVVLWLLPILIISTLSGCMEEKERSEMISPPLKNVDPIPVLAVSGTIDPNPDFFNQTKLDAFAYEGDIVIFDASNSYDPDGNITAYGWILDEENNKGTGPVVSHSYTIKDKSVSLPSIIQIILTIEDNDGSIVFHTFNLGIIQKEVTFYLDVQSLKNQKPETSDDKLKTTFNKIRSTEKLNYILATPIQLPKCTWNATIFIKKTIFSIVNKVTLVLYDSTGKKIAEENSQLKLVDIGKEKTIFISGIVNSQTDFESLELSIYGFSIGKKISILYGGEKASFICFDFLSESEI